MDWKRGHVDGLRLVESEEGTRRSCENRLDFERCIAHLKMSCTASSRPRSCLFMHFPLRFDFFAILTFSGKYITCFQFHFR